jgi:iron complex outermembrane receptor protein
MLTGSRSLKFFVSASLLGLPPVVFAQEQPAADDNKVIEEVVVSVERVTQTLQSYEGTAATVSQADLDKLGATNFLDLPSLMPGVEISNYEDNTQLYVRGIGSNANTELGDPAIAPHLDDVYIPRPRGLGVSFFDIERVEVNVGPQGTVRGRNALGGSINIVSRKPKLGEFEGYGEYSVGNYNQKELRGALNIPIGEITAARFSVYSATHDPYVKNTGPLTNVLGWEGQDDIGGRAHFLVKPNEQLSVLLTGDYLQSRGQGSRGVDMFNASLAGINFNDVDDPRQVNSVGFTPVQDTDNYGITLNTTYKTDLLNVQYIGGYRNLEYNAALSTGGRTFDFAGDEAAQISRSSLVSLNDPIERQQAFINERIYGNYSQLDWDTKSLSRTHELRFTSPDTAETITWAFGLFRFKEEQEVFLGIAQDYNTSIPYLEFNQGSTVGESKSAYADVTWAATEKLRLTAGARYSDESKERIGFNYIANLNTGGVAIRTGTPGFSMTGLDRQLRTPDADGDGVPNTVNDMIMLYRAGVKTYGINDTLDEFLNGQCVQSSQFNSSCAGFTGLAAGDGGATVQTGANSDNYIDWRFRVGYDLTDTNLLYALVATGNKAPSFNDTVDLDAGVGVNLFTPPVGPEKATLVELGSKNTIDFMGRPLILNGSIYYTKYTDQVFSTLVGVPLLDNDPNNDAGCRDTDPATSCAQVTLNQNIGKSTNKGLQLDAAYNLDHGFNVAATFLYQDTEYEDGSIVNDNRRNNPNPGTLQVDLGGNELPLTPPVTLNLRVGQTIPIVAGAVDWIVSGTYKSRYFLTAFNGGPGENGAKTVTATDSTGLATAYGTDLMRLYDKVDSFAHLDLGVGYTRDGSDVRVEAFVNNVTDEAHGSQASIDGGAQEFVFNPPRTFGVRVHVGF